LVRFSIVGDVTFGALQYTTTFAPGLGAFDVTSCAAVVSGSITGFNSPQPGRLVSGLAALTGITVTGTTEIVDCLFIGTNPGVGGLVVTVDDASGIDSLPLNPTPQVTVTVEALG